MDNKQEFSLIVLFKLFYQKKLLIALIVMGFSLIVVLFSFIMPYTYSSYSTVLPPESNQGSGGLSSFLQSLSGGMVVGELGKSNKIKIFKEILASRTVAEYIIKENQDEFMKFFNADSIDDITPIIQEAIFAEVKKTGVLSVQADAATGFFADKEEKKDAAKIAKIITNSAIKGLDKVLREKNVSSARKTRQYIEKEIFTYRSKLDSVENILEDFQIKYNVLEIESQVKAIVEQAVLVGAELLKAKTDYQLANKEFQPNSGQLIDMKNRVDVLRRQYESIQEGGLTDKEEILLPLKEVPGLARQYANLYRDREIFEQVILYLETQRHQEAIQEKKDVPVVKVLDEARASKDASSPNKKLMLLLAIVISTFMTLIGITINAFYKGKLYFEKEES